MNIDYLALRFWFDLAQVAGTAAIGIYVWHSNSDRVTSKRIEVLEKATRSILDKVDDRLDDHSDRLTKVETECVSLPNHGHMGEVYKRLNSVAGKVDDQGGELRAIRRSLDLLHQHLLNQGNRQ